MTNTYYPVNSMTTRLTRSIILAAGIALLITASYYWLLNESNYKKKVPKINHYKAEINIHIGAPGETDTAVANVQKCLVAIDQRLTQAEYTYTLKPASDKDFTISIDKLTDTSGVKELLTGNGRLAMQEVYTIAHLVTPFQQVDTALANYFSSHPEDTLFRQNGDNPELFIYHPLLSILNSARPYAAARGNTTYPGYIGIVVEKDTAVLRQLLEHPAAAPYWPADIRFMLGDNAGSGSTQGTKLVYAIKNHPSRITNKHVIRAEAVYDEVVHEPQVALDFDPAGTVEWERMTAQNVNRPIAICVNDKVLSAPTVLQPILGGKSRISLGRSADNGYSKALSVLLKSQELPLQVQVTQARFSPVSQQAAAVSIYVLLFVLSFAMAMGVQWLIIRLNVS